MVLVVCLYADGPENRVDFGRAERPIIWFVIFIAPRIDWYFVRWLWVVFVIGQNCKFFAEIWAQGDFCEFWNLHPSLVKPADFWVVCDVCCVVQNVFIDENFVNKDFYKIYNFFDFGDC